MLRTTITVISALLMATPAFAENKAVASWYHYQNRLTSSGEKFNSDDMTAAHRTYPFGTILRVTYNGLSVDVRINDRGPFVRGRQLDLSRGAARALGCGDICVVTFTVVE